MLTRGLLRAPRFRSSAKAGLRGHRDSNHIGVGGRSKRKLRLAPPKDTPSPSLLFCSLAAARCALMRFSAQMCAALQKQQGLVVASNVARSSIGGLAFWHTVGVLSPRSWLGRMCFSLVIESLTPKSSFAHSTSRMPCFPSLFLVLAIRLLDVATGSIADQ